MSGPLSLPQIRDGRGYPVVQTSVHREEESALHLIVVRFLLKEVSLLNSDKFEFIKLGLAVLVLFT